MSLFPKKFRRDLMYSLVKLVMGIFNAIPRDTAVFIGASLGLAASLVQKKDMHKAQRHLLLTMSDEVTPKQAASIARTMFINFGKNFADVVRMGRTFESQIRPLIKVDGIEHFDKVYNRGKGVIGVTGHIGNFELLAAYFANAGYKSAAIGRELYDKRLNELLVSNRESIGLTNIYTDDSPRKILKILHDGFVLGVLMDTDSFRVRSELIPFFGRLSNTPVGQSVLGLKTGAGFVPVACLRDGKGYKIVIKPEVIIERTDNFDRDLYNVTRECNRALEQIIREHKDQWIWLHNRWHTRPKEEEKQHDPSYN